MRKGNEAKRQQEEDRWKQQMAVGIMMVALWIV
jgi:hypothetical protein